MTKHSLGAFAVNGRKSFEIGLEVGPSVREDEAPYSMSEIIRIMEPNKADDYRNYSARDIETVNEGVRRLAGIFRPYADAGMFDDTSLLTRLEKQREIWKYNFARDVSLIQARPKLDAAWQVKDYAQVVELLRPLRLRHALTSSELHKLEYAEIHTSQPMEKGAARADGEEGKRGQVSLCVVKRL